VQFCACVKKAESLPSELCECVKCVCGCMCVCVTSGLKPPRHASPLTFLSHRAFAAPYREVIHFKKSRSLPCAFPHSLFFLTDLNDSYREVLVGGGVGFRLIRSQVGRYCANNALLMEQLFIYSSTCQICSGCVCVCVCE